MRDNTITLRFPALPEYLVLARAVIAGLARSLPLGPRDVADLELAVTEACGNAVRHAYPPGAPGTVALDLVVAADRLVLVVEDQGAGIGLPLAEGVTTPSERGGMGLTIMRVVTDELDVSSARGRGTIVRMTKRFPRMSATRLCVGEDGAV